MLRQAGGMLVVVMVAASASAGNTYPSVSLPPSVPFVVRDAVARSLTAERDALGWAIHPLRGEFHALGASEGTTSRAYDLSANGRVVVGANSASWNETEAFVWTPWTGNVAYDVMSDGGAASTVATAVSADGVYVAGVATAGYNPSRAFRWSLAGAEHYSSSAPGDHSVTALSANGQVVVGSAIFATSCRSDADCTQPGAPALWHYWAAVSYDTTRGVVPLAGPAGYQDYYGVDVSGDGKHVLLSTSDEFWQYDEQPLGGLAREPFLLSLTDGTLRRLGTADLPRDLRPGVVELPYTRGFAISADGSTVVGARSYKHVTIEEGYFRWIFSRPSEQAVLWNSDAGWIDLGDLGPEVADSTIVTERAIDVSGDGGLVVGSVERYIPCSGGPGCSTFSHDPYRFEREYFLWDESRGMRELSSVMRLDYGLDLGDWYLGEVAALSDDGTTVIGNGWQAGGEYGAWRAVLHRNTPDGDIDFDGDIDRHDYQKLVGNLNAMADDGAVFYSDGDLNADGRVDDDDAQTLLGQYEHRWTGDFNADGLVNAADYTLWRDWAGQPTDGIADANGDGRVNHLDWMAWRVNFGRVVDEVLGVAVPEPVAGWLLGAAVTILATRRCSS
jgi:hypothetical protein